MKRNSIRWLIGLAIIGALIVFIFSQSLFVGDASHAFSLKITEIIQRVIRRYSSYREESAGELELIVRKFAHLLEYMFYGTVVFGVVMKLIHHKWLGVFVILLLTLPVPVIDEFYIQAMTVGRSPQLLDVLIDLLGLSVAFVIGIFHTLIMTKERKASKQ